MNVKTNYEKSKNKRNGKCSPYKRYIVANLDNNAMELWQTLSESNGAMVVFIYLTSKITKYNKCRIITVKTIAENLNMNKRSVDRYIRFLRRNNFIQVTREKRENRYVLNPYIIWKGTYKDKVKCEWNDRDDDRLSRPFKKFVQINILKINHPMLVDVYKQKTVIPLLLTLIYYSDKNNKVDKTISQLAKKCNKTKDKMRKDLKKLLEMGLVYSDNDDSCYILNSKYFWKSSQKRLINYYETIPKDVSKEV